MKKNGSANCDNICACHFSIKWTFLRTLDLNVHISFKFSNSDNFYNFLNKKTTQLTAINLVPVISSQIKTFLGTLGGKCAYWFKFSNPEIKKI